MSITAARASSVLSCAILLGGIITIAVTVNMVIMSYSSLPYADGWTQVAVVANGENPLSPAWLWRQHNEHRLVIPKVFLAADLRLFQARQVFLLASILVIQFLHLLLLAWSMRVLGGWQGAVWRTGVGSAAFCLFCPSQWENFVWGFQVCFVLPGLLATLSFIGLLLYWTDSHQQPNKRPSSVFLLLSIISALGATFSLANGNLLWPLLVAAALLLRLRLAAVLSFTVTGLISTALYLHSYVRPSYHANPITSMETPVKFLQYLTAYVGSSWIGMHHMRLVELIGLAGLAIAVIVLLRTPFYVSTYRPFSIQLVLTIAFCVGTAFITAAGRLNFGVEQAFSSRYQTIALLFWFCLGLLLLEHVFSPEARRFCILLVQICMLAILARAALVARRPIGDARQHGFMLDAAATSLVTGVYDPAQLQQAYPSVGPILLAGPYMKKHHLSVFSGSLPSLLGRPLDDVFQVVSSDNCTGRLESVVPLSAFGTRGVRVAGWAWDRKHRQPPWQIAATAGGTIAGLATVGEWRPVTRAANPWMKTSYVGFMGYVQEEPLSPPVMLYAILPGKPASACYFATMEQSQTRSGNPPATRVAPAIRFHSEVK